MVAPLELLKLIYTGIWDAAIDLVAVLQALNNIFGGKAPVILTPLLCLQRRLRQRNHTYTGIWDAGIYQLRFFQRRCKLTPGLHNEGKIRGIFLNICSGAWRTGVGIYRRLKYRYRYGFFVSIAVTIVLPRRLKSTRRSQVCLLDNA